jgi:hypothetical protein
VLLRAVVFLRGFESLWSQKGFVTKMARWRLAAALLLLCSCVLGEVHLLSKENFENHVQRTEFLVVSCEFCCGHVEKFKAEADDVLLFSLCCEFVD